MACLIKTRETVDLTKHFFPQEDSLEEKELYIRNVAGLWQEANNEYTRLPTVKELSDYIKSLKHNNTVDTSTLSNPSIATSRAVDLIFDPQTRRDRVSLITRLFSNELSAYMQETVNALEEAINNSTGRAREELRTELNNFDRFEAIKKATPAGIFNRVASIFRSYINDSEEGRVQAELDAINADEQALIDEGVIDESERFSDEEKNEAAKKRAKHKYEEYSKMVNDPLVFRALAEEASTKLIVTEGIRIDPNYVAPAEANLNNDDPEGNSELDEEADDYNKEESYKDGWMTNFRQVSAQESLSQAVRKIIRDIPKLDRDGMYDTDDLGFIRYLDPDYVHSVFIDGLRNMINSGDMIPLLEKLEKTKKWIPEIIERLQEDDALFSQFYQDFRKDFTPYWIQIKQTNPNGTTSWKTKQVNKPESLSFLLDSWRDNYESGSLLDKDSIYEKNGQLNTENAKKGLAYTRELNNRFTPLSSEKRLELLKNEETFNTIVKLLNMIGIDPNPEVLNTALTTIKETPGISYTDPIMLLLTNLDTIFNKVARGEVINEDGKRIDLINKFSGVYSSIARIVAEVTEDAIESSVRENGKTYYSHTTPNYLGKTIKNLKNVMNDEKRFSDYIDKEFKRFDWFYKNGEWRNDWIKQIVESSKMREGLQHKVVLNSDKVDYSDWDDIAYTIALLNEYWSEPSTNKSGTKWAWYHVPILSDSPSAEFIRFRKYTNRDTVGPTNEYLRYDEIIVDKLMDLVNQEYDRIMLVRARANAYQSGDKRIVPIANFDIKGKNKGGAEFKFLTKLNDDENFLNELGRIKREETGSELKKFLRNKLYSIMEEGFEDTYRDWVDRGLLDELPNGKLKYLPFDGLSKQHANLLNALTAAKNALSSQELWTEDMENLLNAIKNNAAYKTREAQSLIDKIKNTLREKSEEGSITPDYVSSIERGLTINNRVKEALREYYWNSKFATSQIIQITTTDLAFYKDIKDFQKRFKEIHAPALRLNTQAVYKGERIGRDYERTIYLKDEEVKSSVIDDIKTVLDEKVKKGEMLSSDRDNILKKFMEVNVADAQAYRSLSSYRAILGMMGQWTDEYQRAYDNFKNGKWDMRDFNVIWQTKKPFVYTQISNDSGIEGFSSIKTPVQHKNSEFLLLAMHELIAGPLGKSSKLRALNKFMEANQIDVVQFESTVKVGNQGVIDLNGIDSETDVIDTLNEATGIKENNENPNVVHKIPYEDYGIQTATPEHAIDKTQLIGTQIRRLISADIDPNAEFNVNGKIMTKKEILDLYNAINVENILESFSTLNEEFKDPKKVEKILLDEIRGNQRYGIDMVKACTLNEKGQFNIPLFDPVQSQRLQQLLNSIIKSRITKQKIKGGALIQVSDYGLSKNLHIVFDGEGKNKRIKYIECYMPAYSRQFYEALMDPETHILDINRLPPSLRYLIGYRVPTEDKYSMAPLKIKGFLPQQNGSAIMLPDEITTLSGSDFDELMSK